MKKFSSTSMVAYNKNEKKKVVLLSVYVLVSMVLFVAFYSLFLKNLDFFIFNAINSLISSIGGHISSLSYLGAFLIALIGGFFLVFMPLEVIFITLLTGGKAPFLLIFLYIVGIFISYNVNYFVGYKLADFSKRLIGYKKFYLIKKYVNNHGNLAIFLFNFLPLPSQPLSTILGVFKYNLYKFYVFFVFGQLCKYTLISFAYLYIF